MTNTATMDLLERNFLQKLNNFQILIWRKLLKLHYLHCAC